MKQKLIIAGLFVALFASTFCGLTSAKAADLVAECKQEALSNYNDDLQISLSNKNISVADAKKTWLEAQKSYQGLLKTNRISYNKSLVACNSGSVSIITCRKNARSDYNRSTNKAKTDLATARKAYNKTIQKASADYVLEKKDALTSYQEAKKECMQNDNTEPATEQASVLLPAIKIVPVAPTPNSITQETIDTTVFFNKPMKKEADGSSTLETNGVLGVFQLTNKGSVPVYIQTLNIENLGAHASYNNSAKEAVLYRDNCAPFDRRFPKSFGLQGNSSGYISEYTLGFAQQIKPGECETLVVYWRGIDYRPFKTLPNGDTQPLLTKVLSVSGDSVQLHATGGTYMLRATDMEKDYNGQKNPAPGTSIPFTADATVGTIVNP